MMREVFLCVTILGSIVLSGCGRNEKSISKFPMEAMNYASGNEVVSMDELSATDILEGQSKDSSLPDLNDTKGKSVALTIRFTVAKLLILWLQMG